MSDFQMDSEDAAAGLSNNPVAPIPLFIDLDGTLVKSDLFIESLLALVQQAPWCLFLTPFWLMRGVARLKYEVAMRVVLKIDRLPLQEDLVAFLNKAAGQGRPVYLATASTRLLAEQTADTIGLFSGVLASDDRTNLKGLQKLEAIRRLSEGPFDYAGNSRSDLLVWRHAHRGIVVNPELGVCAAARRHCKIEHIFEDRPPQWQSWIRALRIYQWMKNLLLGVPILTAHAFTLENFGAVALAFTAFGLVASSSYIINDLIDLNADRFHPRKQKRPFAAGDIPLLASLVGIAIPLVTGFLLAALLPRPFLLSLFAYAVLTMSYSLFFKTVVLMDVILLGALYSMRIFAGAAAIEVEISFWLLAFSMFVFFSIALVKRSSELLMMEKMSQTATVGRDYRLSDYNTLNAMGVASGYLSVLVLALFINNPMVMEYYTHPNRLWLLCPLMLYWLSRLWIKTSRGEMHDDPLLFSLKDFVSWLVLFAMTLTTLAAI